MVETGDNINETNLVERAKHRDTAAFSALVKRYQERMLRVAYSFLGNREDARDIAQEAFVKAYESLPGFRGGSLFSTWLHRILVNLCKDYLRKKSVRQNLFFVPRESEEEEETRREDRGPSPPVGALDSVLGQEVGAAIREALETLPLQQRSAFTLRYLDGMSLAEIADTLGVSEGAVKAHVWQAAQKMQKKLAAFVPGRK